MIDPETCAMFFFSSRRRHTRSLCDWSSDVCSSDLNAVRGASVALFRSFNDAAWSRRGVASQKEVTVRALGFITARSEERRVGKESRAMLMAHGAVMMIAVRRWRRSTPNTKEADMLL